MAGDKTERRSRRSRGERGDRGSRSERRRRERREEENVLSLMEEQPVIEHAFMAEGDEDAPAEEAPADDGGDAGGDDGGDAGGDDGGDAGGDDGGDAGGDDDGGDDDGGDDDGGDDDGGDDDGGDDGGEPAGNDWDETQEDEARKFMIRNARKKGKFTRVKMFTICNMFEDAAAAMLDYALDNYNEKESFLRKRQELLQALYYLRYVSDVDDDFLLTEYEGEMKKIKVFRQKMGGLANKEDVKKDSDEDDSTDDGSDGQEDHMLLLKAARKEMQYTFGTPE